MTQPAECPGRAKRRGLFRRPTGLLMVAFCMGFAMLIWLKLRVVTGVPRTAYAEPEARVPADPE